MIRLENLAEGCRVKGILVNEIVTVLNIQWRGTSALELTYKTTSGGGIRGQAKKYFPPAQRQRPGEYTTTCVA